jgi:hypothetical protein
MQPEILTEDQKRILQIPVNESVFLEGKAGAGKTSCAIAWLNNLLSNFPGHQILIVVPQRSLGNPFSVFLNQQLNHSGSLPSIWTLGSLTRRMVELFWPLISKEAGFSNPNHPPQFLSTETAQYCMEKAITPFLEQGFFQSVVLSRNRLYGQILDDLNKSAIIRFPTTEISQWLKSVGNLDAGLSKAYDQVLICANEFRKYCYSNNLLDFSLQVEVFFNHLWTQDNFKEYFYKNFRALIADNVEEDVPATHDLIKDWLPNIDSAFIVFDQNGGYRSFLGADPTSALSIKSICSVNDHFETKIEHNESIINFSTALNDCISHERNSLATYDFSEVLKISDYHFYPEMIAGVCSQIQDLIYSQEAKPGDIVILSPYLSDALNFSLSNGLKTMNIPNRSSRPSQMYINDPSIRAFFTFAKMAHPQWDLQISFYELRNALMVVLPELDIVKADLIVKTLFSVKQSLEGLRSFDTITNHPMQERITFQIGEKIERIRTWIREYKSLDPLPLDIFFSEIFGELFSQKGFGLFADYSTASRIAQITRSIRVFRQFAVQVMGLDDTSSGLEYIRSVEKGLLPSAIINFEEKAENTVLIAPAHTFLMENTKVDYQFWLDIGSLGWWERLNQPLTNPYLLNRNRSQNQLWTEANEYEANQAGMERIVEGLINRCGKMIFVNTVRTNENGAEQRGPLLQAFQTLQKRVYQSKGGSLV